MQFLKTKLLFLTLGLTLSTAIFAADVGKVVESCNSCHGKDGASVDGKIPTIGGMSAKFLMSTFKAYKGKARPCLEVAIKTGADKGKKTDMCKAVEGLSDDDLKALAKHYAELKFVRANQTTNPDLVAKGKEIHKVSCEKCHSQGGSVAADDAGILAGQHMPYMAAQLADYADGKRPMEKKMKAKMEGLDKAAFEALTHFYGSFKQFSFTF